MNQPRLIGDRTNFFQQAVKALAEPDSWHLAGALIQVFKATDQSLNQLSFRRYFEHVFAPNESPLFSASSQQKHSPSGYGDKPKKDFFVDQLYGT